MALALALRAEARHQPVGLDLDHDMLVGDAAGAVQMAGQTEAAALARALARHTPSLEARGIGMAQGRLEKPDAVGRVVGVAARRRVRHVLGPQQIEAAQLDRRAPGVVGGDVDQPLQQKKRLGLAGAADRIDRHGVGEGAVEVQPDRGNAIEAGDHLGHARGRDGGREHRDIGAVVGLGFYAHGQELAGNIERKFAGRHEVAGMAVGQGELGAVGGPAQAAPELACRPGDQHRFGINWIFRAEAAAHILGDQAQLVFAHVEDTLAHQPVRDLYALRAEGDGDEISAGVVGRPCGTSLHVVDDLARRADPEGRDVGCFGESGLRRGGIALAPAAHQVAGHVVMDQRGT